MKTVQIELNTNQIVNLFNNLSDEEKIAVLNNLKESTFKKRFNKLLKSLKTEDLTLTEITREVEIVRQKRYEERKK